MKEMAHAKDEPAEVVVIGDVLVDFKYWIDKMPPVGGDTMISSADKSAGGSAANTAAALGRLGIRTAFCGRVGDDENGRWLVGRLAESGVDTSCVQYGETTGYVLSIIDGNKERTMFSYRGAAAVPPDWTPALEKAAREAKILLLSGYSLLRPDQAAVSIRAAKETAKAGGFVALDPSPMIGKVDPKIREDLLDSVTVLLPNRSEIQEMGGTDVIADAVKKLLERVPCIALKMGGDGSVVAMRTGFVTPTGAAVAGSTYFRAAGRKVNVIHTTGAGDSFNAGFLASMLRSSDPQDWIEKGNDTAAALVSGKVG